MTENNSIRWLFRLFASLLDYPVDGIDQVAESCVAWLRDEPEAAALVEAFATFAADRPLGELEEHYTRAFEMNPFSSLYVGYHLLGESYKRSLFLIGLRERYDAEGFTPAVELPDHLCVMLRFMAQSPDWNSIEEMVREAIVPVLDKMMGQAAGSEDEAVQEAPEPSAYRGLLQALRLVLMNRFAPIVMPAVTA